MARIKLARLFPLFPVFVFVFSLMGQNALAVEGYWDLTQVKKIDTCKGRGDWTWGLKELSEGSIVCYSMATFVSPSSYFERIATWSSPPGTLVPGKTLSLTLKMKNGAIRNPVHSENGVISAILGASPLYDSEGNGNILLGRDKGEGAEISKTFSAPVPGFNNEGLQLRVICSGGQEEGGEIIYLYSWREGKPEPDKTSSSIVDESQWSVNNAPVYWVFHKNGKIEAPGQWQGTWRLQGDRYLVTIVHRGNSDSFTVKFAADGKSFTAHKDGQVYRAGVRIK